MAMRKLADANINALQQIGGKEQGLGQIPGRGFTNLDYGLERLRKRAATLGIPPETYPTIEERAQEQFIKGTTLCESPIERDVLAALITAPWVGFGTIPAVVHNGMDKEESLPAGDIKIVPQMAFVRYRMDFGVVAKSGTHQKIFCIECDGADYHKDAVRDRTRDQYLHTWGIPTFRFSGSNIYEDAIAEVDKAVAAICAWGADHQ